MSDEQPREYDRAFKRPLAGPLQARIGFDREKNAVTRFVVQLEYHHDGEWRTVVRYDHDGAVESEFGHDVSEEGLHIDIYRDGEKTATEYIAPPRPASEALDLAEEHLADNLERSVNRHEQWHGIRDR